MNHQLKTVQPFFAHVFLGDKTAELRKDDRGFRVGDMLLLREYDEESGYSGVTVTVEVTHVLRDFEGLAPGWVMLSFRKLPK